jgi:dTDP-4-dehydrorhamnose reductase
MKAMKRQVHSTNNMIALAKEINAKLVFISTDYIFDGKDGPYLDECSFQIHYLFMENIN